MKKPQQSCLPQQEITFFYENVLAYSIAKKGIGKSIKKVANANGISIVFEEGKTFNECESWPANTIKIFQEKNKENMQESKIFFQHLRNAFAHLYIDIQSDTCKMLDWETYSKDESGKKNRFSPKKVNMYGEVNLQQFKQTIIDFYTKTKEVKTKPTKS